MLLALLLACAPRGPALAPPPGPSSAPPPGVATPAEALSGARLLPDGWREPGVIADVPFTAADPSLGSADARFTVVSFADYFCPHCAGFWPRVKEMVERNPDVRVVYKNYPLDPACNPRIEWEGHRFACLAARAAECAATTGNSVAMADLLYLYPDHVTPPEMYMFAEKAGLDPAAFGACLDAPTTAGAVGADIQAGIAAGITGTPAVYVLGLEPSGWVDVAPNVASLEIVFAELRAGRPLPPP